MKKLLTALIIGLIGLSFATGTYADPGQGHGKKGNPPGANKVINHPKKGPMVVTPGKYRGNPPGWSQGKKVGWRGQNMPPGLAKKGITPTPATFHPLYYNPTWAAPPGPKGQDAIIIRSE